MESSCAPGRTPAGMKTRRAAADMERGRPRRCAADREVARQDREAARVQTPRAGAEPRCCTPNGRGRPSALSFRAESSDSRSAGRDLVFDLLCSDARLRRDSGRRTGGSKTPLGMTTVEWPFRARPAGRPMRSRHGAAGRTAGRFCSPQAVFREERRPIPRRTSGHGAALARQTAKLRGGPLGRPPRRRPMWSRHMRRAAHRQA